MRITQRMRVCSFRYRCSQVTSSSVFVAVHLFSLPANPSLPPARLLAQLNSFVSELFSSASHFTWMAPPPQLLEDMQQASTTAGQNPENKLYRTVHGVVRDPRTGKGWWGLWLNYYVLCCWLV